MQPSFFIIISSNFSSTTVISLPTFGMSDSAEGKARFTQAEHAEHRPKTSKAAGHNHHHHQQIQQHDRASSHHCSPHRHSSNVISTSWGGIKVYAMGSPSTSSVRDLLEDVDFFGDPDVVQVDMHNHVHYHYHPSPRAQRSLLPHHHHHHHNNNDEHKATPEIPAKHAQAKSSKSTTSANTAKNATKLHPRTSTSRSRPVPFEASKCPYEALRDVQGIRKHTDMSRHDIIQYLQASYPDCQVIRHMKVSNVDRMVAFWKNNRTIGSDDGVGRESEIAAFRQKVGKFKEGERKKGAET